MADPDPFAKFAAEARPAAPAAEAAYDPKDPFAQYANATPQVGLLESFGRGAVEGATFGFDDKLGMDKEKREASRKANPWTHFMGEMAGTVVPMVGSGGVGAAVKGPSLLARGARGAASLMTPATEIRNVGQSVVQGAKLGSVYGGLSGAGHADVKEDDTLGEALGKRAIGAGIGATTGAALGAPLGAATHGASRLVGSVLNRTMPELKDVMTAASTPELQGIRDVVRQAGYDKYTMADFAALRERLRDPAQRHLYEGLNLIEALETRPLQAIPITGELKPPIAVSPNLSGMAQDFANTGGAGAQQAKEAFATRKSEMASKIAGDIDRLAGDPQAAALAAQFGKPAIGRRAADIESLPKLVDDTFGVAIADDAAALAATANKFNTRYKRLKDGPLQLAGPEITRVAQTVPEIQQALQYASRNDMLRLAETGAEWQTGWANQKIGEGIQTLSPTNILDMHHFFSVASKPPITGATPETVMMGRWKDWFSKWVDSRLKGHEALRAEYTVFKRTMEAPEMAAKLPLTGGPLNSEPINFLRDALRNQMKAAKEAERYERLNAPRHERWQRGEIKKAPSLTEFNNAAAEAEAWGGVVERFRKTWGEKLKQEIGGSQNPERLVKQLLTPEGQKRIMLVAGEREGPKFINELMTIEARSQGRALSLKGGGDDAMPLRFFDRAAREGNTDVVDAFRVAWGDRIKNELAANSENPGAIVRGLLTQEGKERILKIFGPREGREFIEALYNKQQQLGLSQRLYGGPDTAYKLARNKKSDALMDAVHGVFTLRPGQVMTGVRDMGSAAYKQRRADQGNQLLSQQGPDDVAKVIDAILARYQLARTGQPYVLNPALRALGPATGALPPNSPLTPRDDPAGRQ